jgi:hypothetical protein
MKTLALKYSFGLAILLMLAFASARAQNNSIVLNGAYINLNGGTSSVPIYMVVNQTSSTGISRTAGHIICESQYNRVKWMMGTGTGNYIVPFGYSTTAYLPLTFNKTTAGSSNIDFATWGTNSQNVPKPEASNNGSIPGVNDMTGKGDSVTTAIDRFWDIHTSAPVTANLTFSYRAEENNTTLLPMEHVDAQHWNGTSWDPPLQGTALGVVSGVGATTITGASNFSPWVLVHRPMPLPVELVRFNVEKKNDGVLAIWATATEVNNNYFTIQRSKNGLNFTDIAKVPAGKDGQTLQKYSYLDTEPFPGKSYYRLRQTDFDGSYDFSDVRMIEWDGTLHTFAIYPNPVLNGQFMVDFRTPLESSAAIMIYDLMSRILFTDRIAQGIQKHTINFNPAAGVYIIKIISTDRTLQQTITFK